MFRSFNLIVLTLNLKIGNVLKVFKKIENIINCYIFFALKFYLFETETTNSNSKEILSKLNPCLSGWFVAEEKEAR